MLKNILEAVRAANGLVTIAKINLNAIATSPNFHPATKNDATTSPNIRTFTMMSS
ncbi:MAG: hypothetical protein STSR0002_25280 [Smithella sp.]